MRDGKIQLKSVLPILFPYKAGPSGPVHFIHRLREEN